MHVLDGNSQGVWRVVMHFDVPDVNNAVGTSFRTVLVNSDLATVSVLPISADGFGGTITQDESDLLASGVVFEHVAQIRLAGVGVTDAGRILILQERYAAIKAEIIARVQNQLNFFGFNQARI